MPIRLVDPILESYSVTLHEDGEWTGEHVSLLRAARAIPMPTGLAYTMDPILEKARYVARLLSLDVIEDRRPARKPLPPDAVP